MHSSPPARAHDLFLTLRTGASGTAVVGVATRARLLALKASDFTTYLASEGVPNARSDTFGAAFGYPAELVPLDNPCALRAGANTRRRVRALVGDTAQAGVALQAGGHDARGNRLPQQELRTDSTGIARVQLTAPGGCRVRFIRIRRLPGDPVADYESKWATLTFEVR